MLSKGFFTATSHSSSPVVMGSFINGFHATEFLDALHLANWHKYFP